MKFSDLKSFISCRQNGANTDLADIKRKLEDWNEGPLSSSNDDLDWVGFYTNDNGDGYTPVIMNPDFQRGHVWTEEQQIRYVEYLLSGGESGRDIYFNNPSHMSQFNQPYVLVDGLQRLTAVMKFIDNELPVFDGLRYDDFDSRLTHVDLFIHINDLRSKEEVLTWYVQMNDGGTPHTKEEIERVKCLIEKEKSKAK